MPFVQKRVWHLGVKIRNIIPEQAVTTVELSDLAGRTVAVDAYNILYQFLSIIRGPMGKPLMDSRQRVTSHLSGLFFRTLNFLEAGIKPVFVFDGKPPELKKRTVERRTKTREEAQVLYERALERGEVEEARKQAMKAVRLTRPLVDSAKDLLAYMGAPAIQAPSEGEAQAAFMVATGDAFASSSQDMDSLLFGSARLVRNLSIVGRRRLPGRKAYVEVKPEIIELGKTLSALGITREQLIDLGILVGTDYCEGVRGVGPKTALKLIKDYGSGEGVLEKKGVTLELEISRIREAFLKPKVFKEYITSWRQPDYEGIKMFLCDEHDFSQQRVNKGLQRMREALSREKGKTSLDFWLGA